MQSHQVIGQLLLVRERGGSLDDRQWATGNGGTVVEDTDGVQDIYGTQRCRGPCQAFAREVRQRLLVSVRSSPTKTYPHPLRHARRESHAVDTGEDGRCGPTSIATRSSVRSGRLRRSSRAPSFDFPKCFGARNATAYDPIVTALPCRQQDSPLCEREGHRRP